MTDTPKRRGRPPVAKPAPAKPARKRWEYNDMTFEHPIPLETLNDCGTRGWELVSIYVRFDTVYAVFKREVV